MAKEAEKKPAEAEKKPPVLPDATWFIGRKVGAEFEAVRVTRKGGVELVEPVKRHADKRIVGDRLLQAFLEGVK